MKKLKERVFKNWRTSILGIFLLIGAGLLVWTGKAMLSEAWPVIPIALGLIFIKDPQQFAK